MVVLLIVAIIAAASAPMVTKKLSRHAGTGDSPWVFTGLENSIAYNMNESNSSAIIGATTVENMPTGLERPRLFLNGDTEHPALAFGENGRYVSHIMVDGERNTITFNDAAVGANSTAIGLAQNRGANGLVPQGVTIVGAEASGHEYSTAIGNFALSTGVGSTSLGRGVINYGIDSIAIGATSGELSIESNNSAASMTKITGRTNNGAIDIQNSPLYAIAIGPKAWAAGRESIAIGSRAETSNTGTVALGTGANATANWATSLGVDSEASNTGAIALGGGAKATGEQSIAIGNGDPNINTTTAQAINSIAIGHNAKTTEANQIVLGDQTKTVYIPGNLVVGGNVILNRDDTDATTSIRIKEGSRYHPRTRVRVLETRVVVPTRLYDDNVYVSDRRLKNIGDKYTAGLEELKKLDFFHYTFKKDEEKTPHVGVIAQDLQKVFPDAVTKGEDGYLRIRWEDMFYAIINAVKELDNKIAEIVQNITDMNSRIETQNSINEEQNKTIEEQQKTIELLKNNNEEQQRLIKDLENRIEKLEKLSVK